MPKKLIKTTEGRCSAGQGWVGHPVVDRVTGADQYARLDAEAATAISETQLGWGWRAASSSATARGPIFQLWSNWSSTPALITSVSEQWSTSIKTSMRQNSHLNKLSCCTKPSFFCFGSQFESITSKNPLFGIKTWRLSIKLGLDRLRQQFFPRSNLNLSRRVRPIPIDSEEAKAAERGVFSNGHTAENNFKLARAQNHGTRKLG